VKIIKFFRLPLLLSAVILLSSCLGDSDNEITTYQDTAITSFSIGTLNKYLTTTASDGTDSIYKTTVSCSSYKFYIDHLTGEIYNPDSLPSGLDLTKVVVTATSKNSGAIAVKLRTHDNSADSLATYSSSDSLDFTNPVEFWVYNTEGTAYRIYTARVNMHQEDGDTLIWSIRAWEPQLAALTKMKAVACGGKVFVFGVKDGQGVAYSTSEGDGTAWTAASLSYTAQPGADICDNVAVKGDYLYVLDGQQLVRSQDGNQWETVAQPQGLKQLIGASEVYLYALGTDGNILKSGDNGATWTVESLDDDASLLPTSNINFACSAKETNADTYQLVLIGNRDASTYPADTTAVVWGKVEENAARSNNQPWLFYTQETGNLYLAPRLQNLQVTKYDGALVAIGGAGIGNCTATALSQFYKSYDNGITWETDDTYYLPTDITARDNAFTLVSDSQNWLWIVCGGSGQVWRGRINRLGWTETQTAFVE